EADDDRAVLALRIAAAAPARRERQGEGSRTSDPQEGAPPHIRHSISSLAIPRDVGLGCCVVFRALVVPVAKRVLLARTLLARTHWAVKRGRASWTTMTTWMAV